MTLRYTLKHKPYILNPTPVHPDLQVATFAAELEQYDVAIAILEDTARAAVQNNLLKFSARGHLLNAGICQLCSAPASPLLSAML